MAWNAPDIREHVARRVRVTRMFLRYSLEESSSALGMPVWLLYNKESGVVHFSHRDFLEMERLYKIPWLTFFEDFHEREADAEAEPPLAVRLYLALGENDQAALPRSEDEMAMAIPQDVVGQRQAGAGMRRWA